MYVLAFDTTASSCSVALFKDGNFLEVFSEKMDFGQSEILLPTIQKILQNQKLEFSDLNLIVVCDGPGSFTGVRASVSAARAFALACPEISVTGVSAFDACLMDLQGDELADLNLIVIETKRDDFYFQIYDKQGHKTTEPAAGSREDILKYLKGDKKVSIAGDGTERFLSQPSGLNLHCIKLTDGADIRNITYCGLAQYDNKKTNFPKPLYLRAPDVCLKV